jgi:hypothetical protein
LQPRHLKSSLVLTVLVGLSPETGFNLVSHVRSPPFNRSRMRMINLQVSQVNEYDVSCVYGELHTLRRK